MGGIYKSNQITVANILTVMISCVTYSYYLTSYLLVVPERSQRHQHSFLLIACHDQTAYTSESTPCYIYINELTFYCSGI